MLWETVPFCKMFLEHYLIPFHDGYDNLRVILHTSYDFTLAHRAVARKGKPGFTRDITFFFSFPICGKRWTDLEPCRYYMSERQWVRHMRESILHSAQEQGEINFCCFA